MHFTEKQEIHKGPVIANQTNTGGRPGREGSGREQRNFLYFLRMSGQDQDQAWNAKKIKNKGNLKISI